MERLGPLDKPPFVIFALPRCRTRWLATFLSYNDWTCGHEEIRHARSLEDVKSWFTQGYVGTIETGVTSWWRLVPDGVRVFTLRRPIEEIIASFGRLGFTPEWLSDRLRQAERKLDQIEQRLGARSLTFADLSTEDGCHDVFEDCLPYQHDHAWWQAISSLNLQVNFSAMMRYFDAYQKQIASLIAEARAKTLMDMRSKRSTEIDGVTFAQEPFETVFTECQAMVADHLAAVGEANERKDWNLLRALDAMGALHVTTARSNGRLFGYVVQVLGPSFEEPGVISATTFTFYASPDVPGLGLKMQRAAIEALRERGVGEVLYQTGKLPRLGALFRRLGAQECPPDFLLRLH